MGEWETSNQTTNCIGYFLIVLSVFFFIGFLITFIMTGVIPKPEEESQEGQVYVVQRVETATIVWNQPTGAAPAWQTAPSRNYRRKKVHHQVQAIEHDNSYDGESPF